MKSLTTVLKVIGLLVLLAMLLAGRSAGQGSPGSIVEATARAFVQGYDGRDLAKFDAYFATPSQHGVPEGLAATQDAAHKLAEKAPSRWHV